MVEARTHAIERTSPKGEPFLGTCRLCGAAGLRMADAQKPCPNQRGLSADEALLESIASPAPALPESGVEGVTWGIIDPDYARVFTIARCIAWSEGYALVMHGSFTRDLDLLAVPWEDRATDAERLVRRIASALDELSLLVKDERGTTASEKPHGRRSWTLTFKAFGDPRFIDLSVMPRAALATPSPAPAPVDAAGLVAAREAVERLANTSMNLSLEEWSSLSSTILSALAAAAEREAALEEKVRQSALDYLALDMQATEALEREAALVRELKDAVDAATAMDECQKGMFVRMQAAEARVTAAEAERDRLRQLVCDIAPYIDSIVCYASTVDEYLPNRIARDVNAEAARAAIRKETA